MGRGIVLIGVWAMTILLVGVPLSDAVGMRKGRNWRAYTKTDSFTELVTLMKYPVETYTVQTPDKYLLRLHRLPQATGQENPAKVVFIMHGMFCSSIDWILIGRGKSIALVLHDLGYDVWLGNARGNTYSRAHATLNPNSRPFWEFSWHEIGYIDLKTMIDFAIGQSNATKLDYIGHSQGVTTFLVLNTLRPAYQPLFRTVIGMSPIAFLSNLANPYLRFLAQNSEKVELMFNLLQIYELLPSNEVNTVLANLLCSESSPAQDLCANLLFLAIGPDPIHLNRTLLPQIFNNIPAGISTRQFLHYGNVINSGRFQHYDFRERNLLVYQSRTPPDYPLSRLHGMNFHFYYGTTDTVMAKKDVYKLVDHLIERNNVNVTEIANFNHLDYLFALNVQNILYRPVLEAMGVQDPGL